MRTLEPNPPHDDGRREEGPGDGRNNQGHVVGETGNRCDIDLEQGIIANDHLRSGCCDIQREIRGIDHF